MILWRFDATLWCTLPPRSSEIPIESMEDAEASAVAVEEEVEEEKPRFDFNIYVISEESNHAGKAMHHTTNDR